MSEKNPASDTKETVDEKPALGTPGTEGATAAPPSGALKVYPIRWFILALFVLYSMSNAFQWIQYSIINNIIVDYYGVKSTMVDWTSMLYMVTYIPLIFPASWYLEKKVGRAGFGLGFWGP
ncbi:putative uncharacterized MFS-type transporter C09D4.1 [Penaeus vannamei]|uniref:Uncharacterized MFS-type transporter C09D4.1 n=1 Tax=Penaeus vannamei TaxID=6689 RepID=A0A423TZ63_PENVA|nr:feline leukemia virus subgroup C receptor-related protein 1-like [Penaeus vannamei]ROT81702.1 putative uncharacterized MFS-type transporter C09D4.1 [Penaeus vannamei]